MDWVDYYGQVNPEDGSQPHLHPSDSDPH